jgi:hypothetical protein
MGVTVLIASRHFSLLPSHLPLPSPFTAPWLTPLFMPLLLSLLYRPMPMTRGTTLKWKAPMAASYSPTHGATKMAEGEIPELTDFFKKTTVTKDDAERTMTVDG